MPKGRAFIGTSGWTYPEWSGKFYPAAVKAKDRLAYYVTQFNALEINSSFYALPDPKIVARWAEQAPSGFTFCFKAPRIITHLKKLQDCRADILQLKAALQPAADKTGPLLFQLPPSLGAEAKDQLETCLALLQEEEMTAAVEFRNPSWCSADIYALLQKYGAAIVQHDMAGSVFDRHEIEAPFIYQRYHGTKPRYRGAYGEETLRKSADHLQTVLDAGKNVYIFFNNTAVEGAAVIDAAFLAAALNCRKD